MATRHFDVYHPSEWVPPQGSWASSAPIRRTMVGNRSRDTRPEMAVRSASHALGLRYRVARRPLPPIRRTADMVFPRALVAVFVDGCFWHGCPQHFVMPQTNRDYWEQKIRANALRDSATDALLQEAGWAVLRVWEHDEPSDAARRIHYMVAARTT